MRNATRALDITLLMLALVLIWQIVHHIVGETALTAPLETLSHLGKLLGQARFWAHIIESVSAFLYAVLIAWLAGVGIGVWLGARRLAGDVAEPILVALHSIPKVTLYPVLLLLFGLGFSAKVVFGAIHGIVPVAIFALNAVRNIKPVHIKAARMMNLEGPALAWRVLIPAALPEVFSGLRVGFALSLLGVQIGEMFASKQGLGFLIVNSINLVDTKTMMAVVILLFAFAAAANGIMLWIDHRLHRRA